MSINRNLRQLRTASGMTQEQVAEKLGVTRQTLSSYESGRTRPDIDMLMRLGEIYGTDLNGILYGQDVVQTGLRRVKAVALILFILLIGLNLASAALLWCANTFFPLAEGQVTQEQQLEFHIKLTGTWEAVDGVLLAVSLVGFVVLLLLIWTGKCRIPLKYKLIYMAVLSVGMLFVTLPFALTDPVFTLTDYIITTMLVISRMLFFFAINLAVDAIQRKAPAAGRLS